MRSLAIDNFISNDGFIFQAGPAVHRTALKLIHAAWEKHLRDHGNNADALVEMLFDTMLEERSLYLVNGSDFWHAVKSRVSWALFLDQSAVSDVAEGLVLAARNFLDRMEDEGRTETTPRTRLGQLAHSWIQWHDEVRRKTRDESIAMSFVPPHAPSRSRAMSFTRRTTSTTGQPVPASPKNDIGLTLVIPSREFDHTATSGNPQSLQASPHDDVVQPARKILLSSPESPSEVDAQPSASNQDRPSVKTDSNTFSHLRIIESHVAVVELDELTASNRRLTSIVTNDSAPATRPSIDDFSPTDADFHVVETTHDAQLYAASQAKRPAAPLSKAAGPYRICPRPPKKPTATISESAGVQKSSVRPQAAKAMVQNVTRAYSVMGKKVPTASSSGPASPGQNAIPVFKGKVLANWSTKLPYMPSSPRNWR